ncbi:hypothetical protein E2C01_096195 [Portunus trituberculatus]|uniref:Uncharacterized protein n=1 Tax=Portunus trituberculatus TaxID=210409 RepID=A0A5B7JS15_PORTR|nr:hypothetical protein [Portunus trituberculatus]
MQIRRQTLTGLAPPAPRDPPPAVAAAGGGSSVPLPSSLCCLVAVFLLCGVLDSGVGQHSLFVMGDATRH